MPGTRLLSGVVSYMLGDDHQSRTVADQDVAGWRCPQRGAAADLKQGTETLARIYKIAQKL